MSKLVVLAALLMIPAAPVAAQVTSIQSARPAGKVQDPNRKLCEKLDVTGSRLGFRKVCMTAKEWATQRQDHRNDIERAQKNAGILNPG
ncbi:MAG: hypothetical protein LH610_01115 [Sphingomonas bacterium]|nr:hypothetical protein [Sphingomonas bacterium]